MTLATMPGAPVWAQTVRLVIAAPTGQLGAPAPQVSPQVSGNIPLALSQALSPALTALQVPPAIAQPIVVNHATVEAVRPVVAAADSSYAALRATALPAAAGGEMADDAARKSFDGKDLDSSQSVKVPDMAKSPSQLSPARRTRSRGDGPALDAMTQDTLALVKMSKAYYKRHPKQEDAYDWIDQSIIPNIEDISTNPDFAVTGSCSGHDAGVPFISIVFKNAQARDKYLPLLMAIPKAGKRKSKAGRLQFFKQYPEWNVKEEWMVGAPIDGKKFWKSVTGILARIERD